ncbi:hypothetical protein BpHYR1_050505 [Brachionus plicatilis]|uniref:Uncharacterized protein n=1 Tax=Brachionus plicatilis TaxID=10195 RepID=A0A3M7S8S2_BRAPC|nr:hypothetical protein BpHYR1_050505 [Brachionus plicatilis]
MKFSICLVFAIVGLVCSVTPIIREVTVPEATVNGTRCIYFSESNLLSCEGVVGEVECDAFSELDVLRSKEINFFGIRQLVDLNSTEIGSVMFELFPREIENTTYMNNMIEVEGEDERLVMYTGETGVRGGIRVSSVSCWQRLVEVLKSQIEVQMASVDGVEGEVPMIGEVAISDRRLQKKWLWYGLGYGYYGYPFGFYGK